MPSRAACLSRCLPTLLAGFTTALPSQEPPAPPPGRAATVLAGIGNTLGWFGAQGELYFGQQARASAFVGAEYTPAVDEGDPSGPTFAIGVRGYTSGLKHRGFLALSLSQLAVESGRGGFTALVSAGLGYAPGVPEGEKQVGEVLALGFGYTWRR